MAYDAYHLLRSLYENYLTVKYVYKDPNRHAAFSAQLGTLLGTHKLATNKAGTSIQSQIIDLKTGELIAVPSRWSMASQLGDFDKNLYNSIYRTLSSYSHSEITNVQHFINDKGYDYLKQDFSFDVLSTCHLLCMLYFENLAMCSPCLLYLRGDLSMNAERSMFAIFVSKQFVNDEGGSVPTIYQEAIEHVSSTNERLGRLAHALATRPPER